MDIWDWVGRVHGDLRAGGHNRLSQLVRSLPGAVCDNEHARVDALVPEALALSRAAEHPWLEVFVRHWNLQSRILHRHHVEEWMGEAVSLLEFANRPETRDCPQSICVTQDLVNCYANADGPGYAEERLAASRETLSRIDATWPCFCCIGGELIDALLDAGRPEEALAELDRIEAELALTDEWDPDPMGDSRVSVLRVLGRYDEALTLNERLAEDPDDEDSRMARRIEQARILAEMGRDAEAHEALPRFAMIEGTHSLYRGWIETVTRLVIAEVIPNEWAIERRMRAIYVELRDIGVIRHALAVCLARGELALARGRVSTARRAIEDGLGLLPRLRAPLDAPEKLSALSARVEAATPASEPAPMAPEAVLAALGVDPERDLEHLLPTLRLHPDDRRLAVAAAAAWRALGDLARAEALLDAARVDGVVDPAFELELGRVLRDRGDWPGLAAVGGRLAGRTDEETRAEGRNLMLLAARRSGDRDAELAVLAAEVEAQPDDPAAATRLADAQAEHDPTLALATLDALIARAPDPGPWDWRRILVATRLDRWDAVRSSGARLGMRFESEAGPVDEIWELMHIEMPGAEGARLWAMRTGPVTARIMSVSEPDEPCHYADELIFDPLPLDDDEGEDDDDDGTDEAAQPQFHTYRCVQVRRPGGQQAFVLDALYPGDDAVQTLSEAIESLGGTFRNVTGGHYRVTDPDTEQARVGLYARIAVPVERIAELDALLTASCADWPGAAVWTELLETLGESERLEAQRALMERWGM